MILAEKRLKKSYSYVSDEGKVVVPNDGMINGFKMAWKNAATA
jgi:nitric oxide synthase oxygenase domain/subunit